MADVEEREYGYPSGVFEAHEQLRQVELDIKRLTSLKENLRKYLRTTIEVAPIDDDHKEGVFDGIRRLSYTMTRTSWVDVASKIRLLVPQTKWAEVDRIIAENTRKTWVDRFSVIESEENEG